MALLIAPLTSPNFHVPKFREHEQISEKHQRIIRQLPSRVVQDFLRSILTHWITPQGYAATQPSHGYHGSQKPSSQAQNFSARQHRPSLGPSRRPESPGSGRAPETPGRSRAEAGS